MFVRTQIPLLALAVLQYSQADPAVVEWYLKKQGKEQAPAKINQNARAFRVKHNTHDHEKEWQETVAEAKGEDAPKRKYGKKGKYTPKEEKKDPKPARKEMEVKKVNTQNSHQFDVKPAGAVAGKSEVKPVTTAAAKSATSLHNTMSGGASSKSKSGSKDKAHKVHKSKQYAAGPAPGPAPAPAPAPLNYEGQVAKLKGDMMNKLKVDSFDADLIIHRPTATPPGNGNAEVPVPEFKDIGNDFGPYAKKPKPLKHDDVAFKPGSLPVDAAHVNRQTMTSDWHQEYGPNGPKGIHGTRPGVTGRFLPLQAGSPNVQSQPPLPTIAPVTFARPPSSAIGHTVSHRKKQNKKKH